MDVLKTELEEAFATQHFDYTRLNQDTVDECHTLIRSLTKVNNGCAVLSDLAADKSYFSIGSFGDFLGLSAEDLSQEIIDSVDEDCIYHHIHPEDLVDKRMLELKFFRFLCELPVDERLKYRSSCCIRMINGKGEYKYIANQTQILQNSPCGKMWLALCQYDLSPEQSERSGIQARITNNETGEVMVLSLSEERYALLSVREREILHLIKEGFISKEISVRLGISIHTVNRHRQNILEKLSVDNSLEAIRTAEIMKLL